MADSVFLHHPRPPHDAQPSCLTSTSTADEDQEPPPPKGMQRLKIKLLAKPWPELRHTLRFVLGKGKSGVVPASSSARSVMP